MEDQTSNEKESTGFNKASSGCLQIGTANKRDSEDFSFMKKRVRVNGVDKNVQEYHLEQEERDAKKRKGRKNW